MATPNNTATFLNSESGSPNWEGLAPIAPASLRHPRYCKLHMQLQSPHSCSIGRAACDMAFRGKLSSVTYKWCYNHDHNIIISIPTKKLVAVTADKGALSYITNFYSSTCIYQQCLAVLSRSKFYHKHTWLLNRLTKNGPEMELTLLIFCPNIIKLATL